MTQDYGAESFLIMPATFVHNIDPIIGKFAGVYLWWYGLSYTLGFLGIHFWFRRQRDRLNMPLGEVYGISLFLAVGVLLGGRFVEIAFYEWDYYSRHLMQIPAYWLGGMATHGLLLGATLGTLLFCWRTGRNFLDVADELVIPAAWIMGMGRIGNFIDGQISGAVTDVWWAVQFPDLEGFRHPVVLYDGLKNLFLIPLLLWIRRRKPPRGVLFAHFIFWYAALRLLVDVYREYRVSSLGLGTGQVINIGMAVLGLGLLVYFNRRQQPSAYATSSTIQLRPAESMAVLWTKKILFALLLLCCLCMPSDWTQDVPERYGERHPGLEHSWLYPRVER